MGRVVSVVSGDYKGFVHRLGKGARRELVEIAAEAAGGATRLAGILGVTPQAIYKFLNERAHPSDRVVSGILEFLSASAPSWARRRGGGSGEGDAGSGQGLQGGPGATRRGLGGGCGGPRPGERQVPGAPQADR